MAAERATTVSGEATIYPIVRLFAALGLMTMGGLAMYASIVAIDPIAQEFAVSRGSASLGYALFMLGFGSGGVLMGRVTDRLGIARPLVLAGLALPGGLVAAAFATGFWHYILAIALLCGFLGASPTFAPLISDISHWFVRRRGLAVAIVVSGTYLAGALWPPILQYGIDSYGWRQTFIGFGILAGCVMLPLSVLFRRRAPVAGETGEGARPEARGRPLGLAPTSLQCLICAAGIGCCVAMAMPQVHIVPYATDLGYVAARGAEMLALMLGCGIVSRLISGWVSDRIGGLRTLLLGSFLQAVVLVAFLTANSLSALYLLSIAFGLSQGGIVPSYAIIVRSYFPAGEAGWRIGATLLFTMVGMALGGWLAGALYDLTGDYTLSFINAVAFNVMNMAIVAWLLARARTRDAAVVPRAARVGDPSGL